MTLRKLFKHNPFENQVAAGASTAHFPLRGHEDALEGLLRQITLAIDNPDYPATAQHTIVFGEWGHGKSHVLRTLEFKINELRPQKAKAIFFEPSDSEPDRIFRALCELVEVSAASPSDFVDAVREKCPENLFLLMDETQAVVGEQLSETYEANLASYWQLLGELQQAASDKLYGLHVFHGLSANSARAISKIGQIPAIKQFARRVFSLRSLDEQEQWQMFCDHLDDAAREPTVQAEELIARGVSVCINELTGGNPRYALALMGQLFRHAHHQDSDHIDGTHCFHALCEVPRFDASGNHYFDYHAIHELLEELNAGQQFEKRIAKMLQEKMGFILGEWGGIEQAELANFELTSANIRKRCDSLKTPSRLFEQPIGETHFRPTSDFFRLTNVTLQQTLTDATDKDLLLSIQLEPETKIPRMEVGLQQIMTHNNRYGTLNRLHTSKPSRLFVTDLSREFGQRLRVGFAVFKGREIPQDVFPRLLDEVESGRCTAIIYIEDADTPHDLPGSSFDAFCSEYRGDMDLGKRFMFINNTNQQTGTFDEDFFVKLAKTDINEAEARDWYSRLRVPDVLKAIQDDCVYCPSQDEQTLINEVFQQERSLKIRELKELNDRYQWVNRERLAGLYPYISKAGSNYTACTIDEITPFKFVLGQLQGSSGLTQSELEDRIRMRYILTGDTASMSGYVAWVLDLLMQQNKVSKQEDVYAYKDLDREFLKLQSDCSTNRTKIKQLFAKLEAAQVDVASMQEVRDSLDSVSSDVSESLSQDPIDVRIAVLQNAAMAYSRLVRKINAIPNEAREELGGQFEEVRTQFPTVESKARWPYVDLENPYELLYGLANLRDQLQSLEQDIQAEIPQQQRCRKMIVTVKSRLKALDELLGGTLCPGTYDTQDDIDICIFNICNALRDFQNAKVRVTLNDVVD